MGIHILIRHDFYTETTARSHRNRLLNSVCIAFSYFPRIYIYAKSSRHWVSFESSNQIIHIPIYSLDSRYPERYPFMYTTDSWYTGKLTHFFISVAIPRKLLPSQASQFRACTELCKMLYVFEHKTQYLLIHAPLTHMGYFDTSVTYPQCFRRIKFVVIPPHFV